MRLLTRAIRPPPDDITPNPNDPAAVPPATVGPDQLVVPGDPHGVVIEGPENPGWYPPRIIPSAWSGWPADWWPPLWGNDQLNQLTDVAWMCVDLNASVLATMPPYLVDAAPSLNAEWLRNPDPDVYTSWEEMAKQLFWDYQLGEAFVIATARYGTGWPARFHVVSPMLVNVEMEAGRRRYTIGDEDVSADMLHIRYQSRVGDAHGHGPLEVGQYRQVAAQQLIRYATGLASRGGIPPSVLEHPEELSPAQATQLQAQWVQARLSTLGEPAVLSGGVTWKPTALNPNEIAMTDQLDKHEGRICNLLGVPEDLVGVNATGNSMTYQSVLMLFLQHWRAGLRPKAQYVMSALSEWLLPRQTRVELNRDAYIEPEPLTRAQTAQILNGIKDEATGQTALTVEEIRAAERLNNSTPDDLSSGVLR